jgi:hypothetical protein
MTIDYKSTLNLPKTAFPMKGNLAQREPERAIGVFLRNICILAVGKPIFLPNFSPCTTLPQTE